MVQEYIDLDHAEPVPTSDISKPVGTTYYLPMHGVSKDSSSITKLRVVFDASAKTSTGASLNDTLLVGPTLYPHLTDILIRFRAFPVAISGDVAKMYRAVELTPEDRDLHRFIWRPDQSSEPRDYCMKCVTFGVASSPFLAVQASRKELTILASSFLLHVLIYSTPFTWTIAWLEQTPLSKPWNYNNS